MPNGLLIPQEEFFEFLKVRRDQLDGVVVSGGEPTIHPDLAEFFYRIKAMGYAVKLDTNGSKPEVLQDLLKSKLVDYVAMDVKAPLHIYKRLTGTTVPVTCKIKESIRLISGSGLVHEFRTTVVPSLLSEQDIKSIQGLIPSGSRYRLQRFCREHALNPALRIKKGVRGRD